VWAEQGGDWVQAVAHLSELCEGLVDQEEQEGLLLMLEQQFPTLPPDVVRSVWTDRHGDEAAVMEVTIYV